jgi:hypothetical protein
MRRRAYSKPAMERSRHGTDFKMDAGAGQFVTWSSKLANVFGVKNAPADFLNWAMQNGAVSKKADTEWQALLTRE